MLPATLTTADVLYVCLSVLSHFSLSVYVCALSDNANYTVHWVIITSRLKGQLNLI